MSNDKECFKCAGLTKAEHAAIRALRDGDADSYQQKLALKVIVNKFSRSHDGLYIPDSFDQSSFLSGRAFVGQKILKYLNIPVGKLQEEEQDGENTKS